MQNKIIHDNSIFRNDGKLREAGYSFKYLLDFNSKKVIGHKSKIKAWDTYLVQSHNIFIRLTLLEFYSFGVMHYTLLDTNTLEKLSKTRIIPKTKGRLNPPDTPINGSWRHITPRFLISFTNINNHRELCLDYKRIYKKEENISLNLHIAKQDAPSLFLTTELSKKFTFNYQSKTLGLKTSGYLIQNNEHLFLNENSTFTSFYWNRCVSDMHKHEFVWTTFTTVLDNKKIFSLSLGYGLGDDSQATENFMVYDNNPIKLEDVSIVPSHKRKKAIDYSGKWRMVDNQHLIDLTFEPFYLENNSKLLKARMKYHHLYGYFSGTCVIDKETTIELKNIKGFLTVNKI